MKKSHPFKLLFLLGVFSLMSACGESGQVGETTSSMFKGKKIDCQVADTFGNGTLFRTFFGFTDDGDWSKLSDGIVTVTIKSNVSKGDFAVNDIQMVPYIKSGNVFTPEYPQHWDFLSPDKNIDVSGNVESECFVSMVVPK